jgi:chromosome segregation ATPase
MIERRHPIELYAIELEKARATLAELIRTRTASGSEISTAAVRVKELEIRVASARLAQAEYYLGTLKARVAFLEARTSRPASVSNSEEQELAWARDALPANTSAVSRLSDELRHLREELRTLVAKPAA